MPTAFITGIAGQDGGYLADRLLAEQWRVHGLVHDLDRADTAALRARCDEAELHSGDLAAIDELTELIERIRPDVIYNLGGVSSVAFSWEHPIETARVSGMGAAGMLEAAWRLRQSMPTGIRVLQASSAEVFGEPEVSPQSEVTPLRPASPYGAAKAFAHYMVGIYRRRGLHASTCILYNHESPRRPTTFVTRKITQAAAMIAAGRQDRLTLGNLDVRRDWGFAPDYVDAMMRAARHPQPDDYVVATGVAHSVRDFVAVAFARAGITDWRRYISVDEQLARPFDAVELVGDSSKARNVLSWRPTVTFEELVNKMVDHDIEAAREPS